VLVSVVGIGGLTKKRGKYNSSKTTRAQSRGEWGNLRRLGILKFRIHRLGASYCAIPTRKNCVGSVGNGNYASRICDPSWTYLCTYSRYTVNISV